MPPRAQASRTGTGRNRPPWNTSPAATPTAASRTRTVGNSPMRRPPRAGGQAHARARPRGHHRPLVEHRHMGPRARAGAGVPPFDRGTVALSEDLAHARGRQSWVSAVAPLQRVSWPRARDVGPASRRSGSTPLVRARQQEVPGSRTGNGDGGRGSSSRGLGRSGQSRRRAPRRWPGRRSSARAAFSNRPPILLRDDFAAPPPEVARRSGAPRRSGRRPTFRARAALRRERVGACGARPASGRRARRAFR